MSAFPSASVGWSGLRNGRLLAAAQLRFDVFVTVDRSIAFQRDVATLDLAVVILEAASNDIDELRLLIPRVLALLPSLQAGDCVRVRSASGRDRENS